MSNTTLIAQTIAFVKQRLEGAEGGHDWFHTQRVYKNALRISREEEVDLLVVSLGALLHDIADAKFHGGDETQGPKIGREHLLKLKCPPKTTEHVVNIIKHISFKNSLDRNKERFRSKELDVVQDADRLDAMGAIGIARAFNYGGYKNRTLYNPEIAPNLAMSKAEYKKSNSATINHFYEKLLLLKDLMKTETGAKLAAERHQYMLQYLEQFYKEWNGQI